MNKNLLRHLVSFGVFIIALIIFSIVTNRSNEDLTANMSEATLPVMYFHSGDTLVNELHAYVDQMDPLGMRDCIIPVGTDRSLSMSISTYDMAIDKISYEIRSMDNERLVADDEVSDYEVSGSELSAEITVANALEDDKEYLMIFTVSSGQQSYYYYTRIMETTDCYVDECLDFALEFHNNTFDDDKDSFFKKYMEATTNENTSLNYVDLTCSRNQIEWGDFDADVVGDIVTSYKEINDSYNVITISYVLSDINTSGETEYYDVEEYYRLRYSNTRMYVLNFERTMTEIFRGENSFINEDDASELVLGIRDSDVEYCTNENGDVICFVQEGDLWCYNRETSEISQVFSFRNLEGIDVRENWNQHDIKIVGIDEAGSVDFIVYGYMNRGNHEGQVGTAVYHYDGLAHTVEEEAFIPSDISYARLKAETGKLMYKNEKGLLYILLEGNVYSINMSSLKVEKVIEGLESGCYAVSESNKYFAWVESDKKNSSTVLNIMNLEDGSTEEISEGSDCYLKPLGFIDNDFIYGIANSSDITSDAAGNCTFAMKSLKILATSEDKYTSLKEYSPSKAYIESIDIDGYTITVNLIKSSKNKYVSAGTESIMNKNANSEENIVVNEYYNEENPKETLIQLAMNSEADVSTTKLLTPQSVILEADTTVEIPSELEMDRFYVYVKGEVILATDSISDAISQANADMGVVVDTSQQYVWERARNTYVSAFSNIAPVDSDSDASSVVKCVSAMINYADEGISVSELFQNGSTAEGVLKAALPNAEILDVSGCDCEDILFYISQGSPVFAMTGNDSAILVIGYSTTNIYYYAPDSGEVKSVTYEDADEMFTDGSNKFITYINK